VNRARIADCRWWVPPLSVFETFGDVSRPALLVESLGLYTVWRTGCADATWEFAAATSLDDVSFRRRDRRRPTAGPEKKKQNGSRPYEEVPHQRWRRLLTAVHYRAALLDHEEEVPNPPSSSRARRLDTLLRELVGDRCELCVVEPRRTTRTLLMRMGSTALVCPLRRASRQPGFGRRVPDRRDPRFAPRRIRDRGE